MTAQHPETRCYFINLDRSVDRRSHMEREIEKCGLLGVRIPAVDGKLLTNSDRDLVVSKVGYRWEPSDAAIGCYLSHRMAWSLIAEHGASYGVVFEDDVLISERAADLLSDLSWIPAGVDCVKIEATNKYGFHKHACDLRQEGYALTKPLWNMWGTGGYIISREGARYLLDQSATLSAAVDVAMFNCASPAHLGLDYLQLHPALCIQQALCKEARFLPHSAPVSIINAETRLQKPKVGRTWKLRREFWRLVSQLRQIMRSAYFLLRHQTLPRRVRFRA